MSPAEGLPRRPYAARQSCNTTVVGPVLLTFNVLVPPGGHPASGCPGSCTLDQAATRTVGTSPARKSPSVEHVLHWPRQQVLQHPPLPPVVGTGQPEACRAHQEVRSSHTLLPELCEEDEDEEESVLLSLLFLPAPLLLPLLLLLVDASR